jgi:hypothetical protein
VTDTPEFTLTHLTQPSGRAPGARRRTGRVALVAAGLIVLTAGGAAWIALRPSGRMTVHGTVTIPEQAVLGSVSVGDPCGGYGGVDTGTEVDITDSGTKTIALASLGDGHVTKAGCEFPWATKVPTGKGFYGASVGGKGVVKLSEAEMRQLVVLSVG